MPVLERVGEQILTADTGEIVVILGAPGSGKTRLAMELAFLSRPTEGEVLLDGRPALERKGLMGKRPPGVTMLVQNAEEQLFARTIFDDIAFGPRHLAVSNEDIESRVLDALRAVRLDAGIRDRSPFALSGGERRRVALAGVLAMKPKALILDEPCVNLDARTRAEFRDLLQPLRQDTAIVWLTSSAREAALADRVYLLLRNGGITQIVGGKALLRDWLVLAQAGIELPGVYQLATALQRCGYDLPPTESAVVLQEAIIAQWRDRHGR